MLTVNDLFVILRERKVFNDTGVHFLVLDKDLHILFVNDIPVVEAERVCPGDKLRCENAIEAPGGCGHHPNCGQCKIRNTVKESMSTLQKLETDANLLTAGNIEMDVHAICTPFRHADGETYCILLLRDQTAHNREIMLERIFFHDLLNLSGAMNGILECMEESDDKEEMINIIKDISAQLMEEIYTQRDLIYAQNGILEPHDALFSVADVLHFVRDTLAPVAMDKVGVILKVESDLKEEKLYSDRTLVNRVIHNLVKNAAQASQPGDTVLFRAHAENGKIVFSVHNDAVMPETIRRNMFLYGNTTKGAGHGMGTYSVKLIGENFLGGKVWFRSEEGFGTEFYFSMTQAQ